MSGERDEKAGARLTDSQRLDWLRLIRSENIGPRTFRALINQFGGAGAALEALPEFALRRTGKRITIASLDDCEREMRAMEKIGARFLALGEPDYPAALRAIDSPPPLLAAKGRIETLRGHTVAIVGSRNASANGLAFAERLAREIGAAGYAVASGLARGIDARVHRASLATGAIGVLAGGLDRVYPSEHEALVEEMLERGAVISEMQLGYEPRGRDFPRRNRIVSGVALATVVVEASLRSGSLITARFANEQGREVFAAPGSPLDPRAAGVNGLLRQGATLCTSSVDVLEALARLTNNPFGDPLLREDEFVRQSEPLWDEADLFGALAPPRTSPGCELDEPEAGGFVSRREPHAERSSPAQSELRERVLALLGPASVSIDELVRAAESSPSHVRTALLELEIEGCIERQPGDLVALAPPR